MDINEIEIDAQMAIVKKKALLLIFTSFLSAFIYWKIIQFNLVGDEIKNGVGLAIFIAPIFFWIAYKVTNKYISYSNMLSYPIAISIGVFVGSISGFFERNTSGIVIQVVLLTMGSALSMIWLYRNKYIKVNNNFERFLYFLTSVFLWVLSVNFIMSFINLRWNSVFTSNHPVGLILNVVFLVIAYMVFVLELNIIEMKLKTNKNSSNELSSYAIELLVDVLWIYIAIFGLMLRARGRKS